jgi:hypothetical protein
VAGSPDFNPDARPEIRSESSLQDRELQPIASRNGHPRGQTPTAFYVLATFIILERKRLVQANKRSHKAYLLKETFDQFWDYSRPGWALASARTSRTPYWTR